MSEAAERPQSEGNEPSPSRRRLARWRRRGRIAATSLALTYFGILAFPDVLFAEHLAYGRFRVASDAPIDPGLIKVLDRAAARLATSPINQPEMIHRIYFCKSPWRKALLAPTGLGAYAVTRAVFEYTVVLGRVEIESDRILRAPPRQGGRSLSGVLAHERTHALIDDHLGGWTSLKCPSWKKEGYCDYIAGDCTFPIPEAKRLIRAGRTSADPAFRYAQSSLIVKYLIEIEKLSVDALMALSTPEDELLAKVRQNLDRL